jgi:hypothetical protein
VSDDDDWFSPANLDRSIAETSAARRADPIACLAELIEAIWTDNTEEEAHQALEDRAMLAPAFANDMLECLDTVIANPPAHLADVLRERAELHLSHDDDDATLYSDQETLDWLKQLAAELRQVMDRAGH